MSTPTYITEGRWQPSKEQRALVEASFRAHGIDVLAIRSAGRRMRVSRARFAAAWALRARWGKALSWPMIAHLLGRRDHSTAIYAARQGEVWRGRDPEFRALTEALSGGARPELQECPRIARPAQLAPQPLVRVVKPRNDFSDDDRDGAKRAAGTDRLLAALRREHPERCSVQSLAA